MPVKVTEPGNQQSVHDNDPVRIVDVVEKLSRVASRVQMLSFRVAMLTLFNILMPAGLYFLKRSNSLYMGTALSMAGLLAAIWFSTLSQLYRFEQERKYGDVLRQEIADEVEWFTKSKDRREFFPFELRQTLRRYSVDSHLPLFGQASGGAGATAYGLWNTVIDLTSIWLALLWMQ